MDIFHDLKRYRTGKTPEGHNKFSIPLRPDDDGMIGRECPNANCQPKYFKVSPSHGGNLSSQPKDRELICPYCGETGSFQRFHTKEQLEWVKSLISRDVQLGIQDALQRSIKPVHSRGGFLSISVKFTPGHVPNVRPYAEEKLKRTVQCDRCNGSYAVYGVSYHCPFCGHGNLLLHVKRSVEIIRSQLEAEEVVKEKGGAEAVYHLYGNCLEDIVSLFEGFLKSAYSMSMSKQHNKDQAEERIQAIKGNFQRLFDASRIFNRDLNIDIFSQITQEELDFLNTMFNKRHVITHNLGLVDEKFQSKINQWQSCGEEAIP